MQINGDRIYLKLLTPEDVDQSYVDWMNDPEITQFLESRWNTYSLEEIKEYVKQTNSTTSNFLFGIFLKDTNEHIGNIKIGNINQTHKFGDVGLIIGKKAVWCKGYGAEAIQLLTRYSFEKLGLNKIIAGIYANNLGSYKAFVKCNYREVGRLKNHRWYKDSFVDEILVEKGRE